MAFHPDMLRCVPSNFSREKAYNMAFGRAVPGNLSNVSAPMSLRDTEDELARRFPNDGYRPVGKRMNGSTVLQHGKEFGSQYGNAVRQFEDMARGPQPSPERLVLNIAGTRQYVVADFRRLGR